VTVARNGRQALDILQRNDKEKINLILTDIMMPEVTQLCPLRLPFQAASPQKRSLKFAIIADVHYWNVKRQPC
jgi:YesN/AraC family two-component response regulator